MSTSQAKVLGTLLQAGGVQVESNASQSSTTSIEEKEVKQASETAAKPKLQSVLSLLFTKNLQQTSSSQSWRAQHPCFEKVDLANDTLFHIFQFLNLKDMVVCLAVCKEFNSVSYELISRIPFNELIRLYPLEYLINQIPAAELIAKIPPHAFYSQSKDNSLVRKFSIDYSAELKFSNYAIEMLFRWDTPPHLRQPRFKECF